MLYLFFFLFVGLTLSAIVWSGWKLLVYEEDPLVDRLQQLQSASGAGVAVLGGRRRLLGGGFLNGALYVVGLLPGGEDYIRDTRRELAQAGIRSDTATARYIVFHAAFMLLVLGGMLYAQRGNDITKLFGGMGAAFILGWLLPAQVLHRLVKRYRQKLQEALPDAVDLLGIVLGTGLSLDQAMTRVSEELEFIYPDLAAEFYTVVIQVRAGQDRATAFHQLVRRTGIEDIKSLSAMIIQSERFGTSLSQALKVYADALRQRRRLRAEAAIAKAGIKMLFPIILFILPVIFAIVLGPGVITVLRGLAGGIGQPR
jgi:tight adherence protein C